MAQLDPDGGVVEAGDVRLVTPGVTGVAEGVRPAAGATRAPGQVSERLSEALAAADLREQVDVELAGVEVLPTPAARRPGRGGSAVAGTAAAEIVAQVPGPGAGRGQVALLVDEDGLLSWHLPRQPAAGRSGGAATRGAAPALTYRIPVRLPVGDAAAGRGPLGWAGRKVVKFLAFPLGDAIGRAGTYVVSRWERRNRPYGLSFAGRPGDGAAVDWEALTAGPVLLLVHGTFSRGASAFAGITGGLVPELARDRYEGRVLVFDHPSVSEGPLANAQWFADQVVAGTPGTPDARLVLDVVAHSRGGLVARALAEQQASLELSGRRIDVRTLVFVGTPNAGTALADTDHLGDLVDVYTNVLDLVPDVGAVDALQVVFEVVKQLATGVAEGLDGLMAMNPGGEYLAALNGAAAERPGYAAVAADFEPAGGNLRHRAVDLLADRVFGAENDLVVPRNGVWEIPGGSLVPADRRLSIASDRAVAHTRYFGLPDVADVLRTWLGDGARA
jgi:hypothetical protein